MEIIITKHYNLKRLKYWLNYELSGSLLLALSYLTFYAILIFIIAAVIFTPFMIKVLIEEERWGWITFFLLFVALPLTALLLIDLGENNLIRIIPLAFFYFYCFLLRITIPDWMSY